MSKCFEAARFEALVTNTDPFRSSKMRDVSRVKTAAVLLVSAIVGCYHGDRGSIVLNQAETERAVAELRAAYTAFNRGDIDSAVQFLAPDVEWIEPVEFAGGGTYRGIDGAKHYLSQSRASADQVISEPEKFISAQSRIVVFVHARVLPKNGKTSQDVRLADVYTFRNGKVAQMRAFANREDALRWVGIENPTN